MCFERKKIRIFLVMAKWKWVCGSCGWKNPRRCYKNMIKCLVNRRCGWSNASYNWIICILCKMCNVAFLRKYFRINILCYRLYLCLLKSEFFLFVKINVFFFIKATNTKKPHDRNFGSIVKCLWYDLVHYLQEVING